MKFHQLLRNKISSWHDLEKQIEQLSTTKERGDVFEQFVFCYLGVKKSLYQIDRHYMAEDIPIELKKKYQLERTDCGVDGLMILQDGKAAAYQVKFRTNREKPSYDELGKFWAEARRTDYHYTISNCYELSRLCAKHEKHLGILVDEFDALGQEFFNQLYQITNEKKQTKIFFEPDDYQKRMISNVVKGFCSNNRGKLIAACGTGKTLTALWIAEHLKSQNVLFIAPSLALIKQTLEAWAEQSRIPFSYLCVCSDKTVSAEVDDGDISITDFNVPVTTSPDEICRSLDKRKAGKLVVFSTYQSLDVLSKGINKLPEFNFDLTIFDEAHRTAGTN
jgi:predicted helicase